MLVIAAILALSLAAMVVMIPLAVCGPAFAEARPRTKLLVQLAWWVVTAAAMAGASAWWRQDPTSTFRTVLAVVGCVAMPALGIVMAVRTVLPPPGAPGTPWYLRRRPRAAAGAGPLRNARLRRD
jgi:hypothetical protein